MRLLRLEGQETERPGYLLTLRDVTADLGATLERAQILKDLVRGVRAARADLPQDASVRLGRLADEAEARLREAARETWPMERIAASDLGAALAARLSRKGIQLTTDAGETLLRCDGFAVVRTLERLALDWAGHGARNLTLALGPGAGGGLLSLEADGTAPDTATLAGWLDAALSPGMTGFTGRMVALAHGTEITAQATGHGRSALTFPLPLSDRAPQTERAPGVLYDFDLLDAAIPDDLAAARVRDLDFVVFDTETTGLNPQVDEICQIAAVRLVNGRIVPGERLDMLVNPGRGIPAASTAVHRITSEMVADAPDVREAVRRFHTFAEGAVLVAHNAPFDMSFLRRREREIGLRFDQPILDTVLCSAILYGQSAEHTLDALCERLGVAIPQEARHTALGDAIGTGEAFRKMIPMLEAADLPDLGALIAAFDRHSRLIGHLN
jgi:DNA polymerase-3 subunit epsilon